MQPKFSSTVSGRDIEPISSHFPPFVATFVTSPCLISAIICVWCAIVVHCIASTHAKIETNWWPKPTHAFEHSPVVDHLSSYGHYLPIAWLYPYMRCVRLLVGYYPHNIAYKGQNGSWCKDFCKNTHSQYIYRGLKCHISVHVNH